MGTATRAGRVPRPALPRVVFVVWLLLLAGRLPATRGQGASPVFSHPPNAAVPPGAAALLSAIRQGDWLTVRETIARFDKDAGQIQGLVDALQWTDAQVRSARGWRTRAMTRPGRAAAHGRAGAAGGAAPPPNADASALRARRRARLPSCGSQHRSPRARKHQAPGLRRCQRPPAAPPRPQGFTAMNLLACSGQGQLAADLLNMAARITGPSAAAIRTCAVRSGRAHARACPASDALMS
jgi:hypothetical protein